ncbi:B12-binding domain-containing radical SAM protein [Romboutsia timonensis]|uniref:B12-binding domain-containing radical SAM protein n=1 Tax=Romboutsia timonensis TaxID=1776391 RepID=UPI003990A2D3
MDKVKEKFRILFISINNVWRYGNIGMDQLLGYLRNKGFNIDIQYHSNKTKLEEIIDSISMEYDLYAFSVNSSNYTKCCDIAKEIKNKKEDAIIDFGGGYPTRYYREIVSENKFIDYIVLGDGEKPTEYLLESLIKNKFLQCNLEIKHDSIATPFDIDNKKDYFNTNITWTPAYDYYIRDSYSRNSRKVHCIQTKNNVCTGNCSFCNERHGKITYKDIDDIVDQIEYVSKNFGVKKIFFTDDNILDPNTEIAKRRLFELCEKLKSKNLNLAYQCYMKANSIDDTPLDNRLLKIMREVGFVEVFIGIESGNQSDLNLYNKYTSVKDNYKIIDLLKKYNIFPILGFISFNPYSSKKSIKENFEFLCNVECTYLFNYLYSFVVINKYTDLYNKTSKEGLLIDDEKQYLDVKYKYKNKEVEEVLDYVRNKMIPKLNKLDYELDWVTYSMLEHEIWYKDIKRYSDKLAELKKKDIDVIKKYLSILFIEFNLEKFKKVEDKFWQHFINEEHVLKEIYDYYISLHNNEYCTNI